MVTSLVDERIGGEIMPMLRIASTIVLLRNENRFRASNGKVTAYGALVKRANFRSPSFAGGLCVGKSHLRVHSLCETIVIKTCRDHSGSVHQPF